MPSFTYCPTDKSYKAIFEDYRISTNSSFYFDYCTVIDCIFALDGLSITKHQRNTLLANLIVAEYQSLFNKDPRHCISSPIDSNKILYCVLDDLRESLKIKKKLQKIRRKTEAIIRKRSKLQCSLESCRTFKKMLETMESFGDIEKIEIKQEK